MVADCYLAGVSTRRMDKLVKTLGIHSLSKSQVSRMAADLDEHVEQFRHRPLDEAGPFTFVAADALTMKVREGGRVINAVVLVATGVNADGRREVLGLRVATSETGAAWNSFFADLVARGLAGVRLVTSDAHAGLVEAIAANLPGAAWQRCRTHYAANLMSVTPKILWPAVKAMLHSVYDQPDAKAVHAQFERLLDAQLAVLVAVARDRITELRGQGEFDLDALMPTPAATAAPTVTGSRSRVLWEVLEAAYAQLGFDAIGDEVFKQLVLARVVEPTSKADTLRVLGELGVPAPPSLRTIWRTLARGIEHDWRATAAAAAYAHATRGGALTLVLYDVTTLYFEAEYEDGLRKVGMSKERRVDPQILVGLLVDAGGFPLEVHAFPGNKGETLTLLPVLDCRSRPTSSSGCWTRWSPARLPRCEPRTVLGRSPERSCWSPSATTRNGCARRPRSRPSAASRPSPHPPARRTATASTAAATGRRTTPSTGSCSCA